MQEILRWLWETIKGLWTIIVGLKVTFLHFFRKPVTMHYPDQRWTTPEAFRGLLKNDIEVCVACEQCARVCPIDAISIKWQKGEKGRKMPTKFLIDYRRCLYCGLCVSACPVKSLFHSPDYENSSYTAEELLRDYCLPEFKVKAPKAKPIPARK
jgi:NADH-quinone oxidoreductase chain I